MITAAQILSEFALECLPQAPLERQEQVYLALAEIEPATAQRAAYLLEATACRRLIEHNKQHARRHAQLLLKFKKTNGGAA